MTGDKHPVRTPRGQAAIDGIWYAAGLVTVVIVGYTLLVII